MRITLVGHFKNDLDEGVRLVARNLAEHLRETKNSIQCLEISSVSLARDLRRSRPEIVHFIISPTTQGLLVSKAVSLFVKDAKTVISAVHPSIPSIGLTRLLKPNIVLTQAEDSERKFASVGFRTEFLPNGVDTNRFRPLGPEVRANCREQYGIPKDKYVVLHLASLKRERNLGIFERMQYVEGVQVVIVGREGEHADSAVRNSLQRAGCIVMERHLPEIQRVYNLADCYVFPTKDRRACIETPLSVLEAMACNLPIISTRYGALPRMFDARDGFVFAENEDEMLEALEYVRKDKTEVETRQTVLEYSWTQVCNSLINIYERAIQ
jgi:glycosyltransferase involved in cell wall biosynthesis